MKKENKPYRHEGGCMTVCMCPNSLNYMLKMREFNCKQVIP